MFADLFLQAQLIAGNVLIFLSAREVCFASKKSLRNHCQSEQIIFFAHGSG